MAAVLFAAVFLVTSALAAAGDACNETDADSLLSVRKSSTTIDCPGFSQESTKDVNICPGWECPYGMSENLWTCPMPELLQDALKIAGPSAMVLYDYGSCVEEGELGKPSFCRLPDGTCGGDTGIPCCVFCVRAGVWGTEEYSKKNSKYGLFSPPFLPAANVGVPVPFITKPDKNWGVSPVPLEEEDPNWTKFVQFSLMEMSAMHCPYPPGEGIEGSLMCPASQDLHNIAKAKNLTSQQLHQYYGVADCDPTASCRISECSNDFPCCVHCILVTDNLSTSGTPVPKGASRSSLITAIELSDKAKLGLEIGVPTGVGGAVVATATYVGIKKYQSYRDWQNIKANLGIKELKEKMPSVPADSESMAGYSEYLGAEDNILLDGSIASAEDALKVEASAEEDGIVAKGAMGGRQAASEAAAGGEASEAGEIAEAFAYAAEALSEGGV